jgi:hypothetical protein
VRRFGHGAGAEVASQVALRERRPRISFFDFGDGPDPVSAAAGRCSSSIRARRAPLRVVTVSAAVLGATAALRPLAPTRWRRCSARQLPCHLRRLPVCRPRSRVGACSLPRDQGHRARALLSDREHNTIVAHLDIPTVRGRSDGRSEWSSAPAARATCARPHRSSPTGPRGGTPTPPNRSSPSPAASAFMSRAPAAATAATTSPRTVPAACAPAVVGMRRRRWGSPQAIGRGSVEFQQLPAGLRPGIDQPLPRPRGPLTTPTLRRLPAIPHLRVPLQHRPPPARRQRIMPRELRQRPPSNRRSEAHAANA